MQILTAVGHVTDYKWVLTYQVINHVPASCETDLNDCLAFDFELSSDSDRENRRLKLY